MKILITGANGFIGKHLCAALKEQGHELLQTVRNSSNPSHIATGDIADFLGWEELLQGVDCVIHLAAMVHQTNGNTQAAFEHANVLATQRLLQAATKVGARAGGRGAHFVFFSTIAVMGYVSNAPMPATHLAPYSPYSHSKLAAEKLVQQSGLSHSIIRIPLTYGAGVRANFQSLINVVQRGVPLPFGLVRNARSLLYVDNLCAGVVRLLELDVKPEMLLLADAQSCSTPQLIRSIAQASGGNAKLLLIPPSLLKLGAMAVGKPMLYHQLCSSLEMDCKPTYEALNWQPPFSLQHGISQTVPHSNA